MCASDQFKKPMSMKYGKTNKVKYQENNDVKNYNMILKMFERLLLTSRFTIDTFLCSYYSVLNSASFEKNINVLAIFEVELCAKYESYLKIFII